VVCFVFQLEQPVIRKTRKEFILIKLGGLGDLCVTLAALHPD
jgi:hypothetical protein